MENGVLTLKFRSPQARTFTIGTRGSPLALFQARFVQSCLSAHSGIGVEYFPIKVITTSGDKLKGSLMNFGGKGLFTKELEMALLDEHVDLAVHSLKDIPTQSHDKLKISCVLKRGDPRDAFLATEVTQLDDLPIGAVIGTASIRRQAQLTNWRPDLRFSLMRGNVNTRLSKLANKECDAIILAAAGLIRLGLETNIKEMLTLKSFLTAPAQGAIAVEIREGDEQTNHLLSKLNHVPTELAVTAERAFLLALDGSCKSPIAALGMMNGKNLAFRGEIFSRDGRVRLKRELAAECSTSNEAFDIGFHLGQEIRRKIQSESLFDKFYS